MPDSNKKKPKVSGISYETDLIKNEDKDNVKCYTPPQQPKSTVHSGSQTEREFCDTAAMWIKSNVLQHIQSISHC